MHADSECVSQCPQVSQQAAQEIARELQMDVTAVMQEVRDNKDLWAQVDRKMEQFHAENMAQHQATHAAISNLGENVQADLADIKAKMDKGGGDASTAAAAAGAAAAAVLAAVTMLLAFLDIVYQKKMHTCDATRVSKLM